MQSLFLKVSIIVTHFSSEEIIKRPTWAHFISPCLAISQFNQIFFPRTDLFSNDSLFTLHAFNMKEYPAAVIRALIVMCQKKDNAVVSEFKLHCSEALGVNQAPSSVTASRHSPRQQSITELYGCYILALRCICLPVFRFFESRQH